MATRIRLRRVGRKKLPLYRIVVADQEAPRDGRGSSADREAKGQLRNRPEHRKRLEER